MEEKNNPPDEKVGVHMEEHILIRYKDTQEVLLNQRADAIFQKNLGKDNAG